MEKFWGD